MLNVEAFRFDDRHLRRRSRHLQPRRICPVPDDLGMVTFDVASNVMAWDAVGAQATADSHVGQLAISATGPWGRVVFDSLETYQAEPPVLVVTYRPTE